MLLYRLGVVPMFLFSGAFFPISQLPTPLEWVARLLPLTSGVDLLRDLVLGTPELGPDLLYIAYLALWVLAGFWLADRRLARRLGDG
jgi:lipooligosaccharide transport system permease protein